MCRRRAEAEERYELFLGLGLLQWRDGRGVIVKRHLLAGRAEIELDAARGVLTVVPAADFESFKLELDILESEDQPPMPGQQIHGRLEELDTQAWDREAAVVVKGPPGPGKNHTIAKLIYHLLACGERILVTAEAPKALSVLRDKLSEELQALCDNVVGHDALP